LTNTQVIETLAKKLKSRGEEKTNGVVALILRLINRELEVLVVKRIENPSDPWSGQIGLPGGKRDAEDQNLKQTVIRETLEETNINLDNASRFLGVLDPQPTRLKPELEVLPFVFLVEHEPQIKLNQKELDWCAWISLKQIAQSKGTIRFGFGEFPAYLIDDKVIWGLTFRILESFIRKLDKA